MEEYTNVHIEWEVVPPTDYATLVSAKLASGSDMADIIMLSSDMSIAQDAGSNDLIIDLTPYWDTCFTNIQAYMDEIGLDYKRNISNEDGSCYAITTLGAPIENAVMLMFNTLWMDQLGLEIPTTIDELTNVLTTMKEAGDLNGNGVDDEILLTSPTPKDLLHSLTTAFGVESIRDPYFAADENGVVYAEYTTENMKALLGFLHEMYDAGILDQEIVTNTSDVISEKVTADRVGVVAFYSSFSGSYGNLTSAGIETPNGEYYTLAVPMSSQYNDTPFMTMGGSYNMFTGISADCENPELAAQWLDVLYADPMALETRCCGKLGETYEYDENGEPKPIMPADGSAWSIKKLGCGQIALPYVQTAQQLLFSSSLTRPWYHEQYANIRENYEWREPSVPRIPGLTDAEAEVNSMYYADLITGWEEYRNKFIIGEKDLDADWDEYVETLEALGMNEIMGVYQSIYDRTR